MICNIYKDKLSIDAKYLTNKERDIQTKYINNYTNKYTDRKERKYETNNPSINEIDGKYCQRR